MGSFKKAMTLPIYIPFKERSGVGGPGTFMDNLQTYLKDHGYSYHDKWYFASAIFFPIKYDLTALRVFSFLQRRIIQRLDGVFYASQHGEGSAEMNKLIGLIYHRYATKIVFQSNYSKRQCFAILGKIPKDRYTIIINGVNKKLFYPAANKKTAKTITFVTTGSFRKLAMLEPIVLALDELNKTYKFKLLVVGPIKEPSLRKYLKRSYIKHIPPVDHQKLPQILRQADAYIHSQLNDNCPNAVLEAISTGLPVVGFNSGAMSELLPFSRDLLAPVSSELIHKYEDFDYKKLQLKIVKLLKHYPKYRQIALKNSYRYSFEQCGQKYVAVFRGQQ